MVSGGPEIPGLPMMNFEEQVQGWDVIFKGLISPFANRFKNYIDMEMNSNIQETQTYDDIQNKFLSKIPYLF